MDTDQNSDQWDFDSQSARGSGIQDERHPQLQRNRRQHQ